MVRFDCSFFVGPNPLRESFLYPHVLFMLIVLLIKSKSFLVRPASSPKRIPEVKPNSNKENPKPFYLPMYSYMKKRFLMSRFYGLSDNAISTYISVCLA
jgi:hypothetical protein